MGLETAGFISDLTPAWPLSTDKIREGDDHLRLLKAVLKASFPNIDAEVTTTPEVLNAIEDNIAALIGHLTPVGIICAFGGDVEDIPGGWALCNGANGTPDLQGKFIRGAGGGFEPGTIGTLEVGDNPGIDPSSIILCYIMKTAAYEAP